MIDSRPTVDQLGLFDDFYAPVLVAFRARLGAVLQRVAHYGLFVTDNVVAAASNDLFEHLIGLCARTLVHNFHSWRATVDIPSLNGRTHYERFAEHIGAEAGRTELLRRYPVLATMLESSVDRRVRLLSEAIERYVADHPDLSSAQLVTGGPVRRIRCSSGDLHNGGRKVLVFEHDDGAVVYKPRHLYTDRFVQAVLDEVNRDLDAEDVVRLPSTLPRANHGWQTFVSPSDNCGPSDARRYFRRIGIFLGVFTALGSSDMHYENLVATCGEPLFIDLETFVQRKLDEDAAETLYEAFFQRVADSVLGTMLLPARTVGAVFDIDISGLGNRTSQVSERWHQYQIVDAGTDDIRFEKGKVALEQAANIARLEGVPLDPANHGDDIQVGFRTAIESLRTRSRAIHDIIFAPEFADIPVRQVLRPTAVYFRFLDAATHPRYLASPEARRELFSKLGPNPRLPAELAERVLAEEIAALADGDVPYLAADFGGRDLIANNTAVLSDAYARPLREQVWNQFVSNVAKPTYENEYLIGAALLTSVADSWSTQQDTRSSTLAELFSAGDALTIACGIGDFFRDTAIWQRDRSRCGWITPVFTGATELTLDLPGFKLYEGGGIPLFLAELAAATGRHEYANLANAAIPDQARFPQFNPSEPDVSAFSGAGSTLYILSRLAALLDDQSLRQERDDLLHRLGTTDFTAVADADYTGGLAGLAVVLANLCQAEPTSAVAPVLAKVISALAGRPALDATALAHGELGVTVALGRAGVALDDAGLRLRARSTLRRLLDTSTLLMGERNWCWGRAGIVQAAARVMADTGVNAEEARAILAEPIAELLLAGRVDGDLSLCHGRAGDARAIGDACRLLTDADGAERAHELLMTALAGVAAEGYRGGLAHSAGLPTFMLGLSGVGHALLAPTGTASVLLLEMEGSR